MERAVSRAGITAAEIYRVMRQAYDELIDFVTTKEFEAVVDELYALPATDRPRFVNEVILNESEMKKRGIIRPAEILLQRSSFGDRRPTLFAVKKYIPDSHQTHWQNVNITFDNFFAEADAPRDERAWRPPLPFDVQQALVAAGADANADSAGLEVASHDSPERGFPD
jgi:hypothetical protein